MKNKRESKIKPYMIIIGGMAVFAGMAGVAVYKNRINIADWISGLSYTPTAEISALEDTIGLTDSSRRILHATHPSLESREAFNTLCDSHDRSVSVLGCYTNNKIYLYDITDEELSGVKESTMAHELLHAVWDRMSDGEKSSLSEKLTEVYDNEQYRSLLEEDLELYDEDKRMDELHSRIGTEIVELPEELEAHYAKYFKDQDTLVRYFNQYVTPFRDLSQKIKSIASRLTELDATIQDQSKVYYELADNLSADITKFNDCANQSGCFSSSTAFQGARNELVSRKDSIEQSFAQVNALIKEYNSLVEEYNESVFRGKNLETIINSNATVETIK